MLGYLSQGKQTLKNGTVEEGKFNINKLEGKGKRIAPDGTITAGTFKEGILVMGVGPREYRAWGATYYLKNQRSSL